MSSLRSNFNLTHSALGSQIHDALQINGLNLHPARSRSPNGLQPLRLTYSTEGDLGADEDPKVSVFKELCQRSEARFNSLFANDTCKSAEEPGRGVEEVEQAIEDAPTETLPKATIPAHKPARNIDEDDYGDDSDSDEDTARNVSPLKAKSTGVPVIASLPSTPLRNGLSSGSGVDIFKGTPSSALGKTSEDVRKKLEEDKKATEDAAKRSFHTLFHTLENDRDAMLDQKKLEESDRQMDVELGGTGSHATHANNSVRNGQQGTLSQTNLGASSLTLKHLIARIDSQREKVKATDTELRSLMSEVRKNRSKWASEDKLGQEELYEAAEKVLSELRAMTEHSSAFLQRVNKREAPDYYNSMFWSCDSRVPANGRSFQSSNSPWILELWRKS